MARPDYREGESAENPGREDSRESKMSKTRGSNTGEEILGQTATWATVLRDVLSQEKRIKEIFHREPFDEVVFIGCGSTYYLSLCAAAIFQSLTGTKARALPASEAFLFPQASLSKGASTLLVAVSRSGETTETLLAAREFEENYGGNVLAITCYEDSTLATRYADAFVIREAKEKGVVQTRSFSSMLLAAQICAGIASERADYCDQLKRLPSHGQRLLSEHHDLIREVGENERLTEFVYLGSGPNYGLACEAMLKMKEMSLFPSDAFHFMEFRHGPKSAVDEKTLVVGLLSDSARHCEAAVLEEARAIGARTLVLADQGGSEEADYFVLLNSGLPELARGALYMPLLQLLAYYRALWQGLDPDSPPHLDAVIELKALSKEADQ